MFLPHSHKPTSLLQSYPSLLKHYIEEKSACYACSNEMREDTDGPGYYRIDDTRVKSTVTKVRLLLTYIFLSLVMIAFIFIRRLCDSLTAARPESG